jgi:hypothetical protein
MEAQRDTFVRVAREWCVPLAQSPNGPFQLTVTITLNRNGVSQVNVPNAPRGWAHVYGPEGVGELVQRACESILDGRKSL